NQSISSVIILELDVVAKRSQKSPTDGSNPSLSAITYRGKWPLRRQLLSRGWDSVTIVNEIVRLKNAGSSHDEGQSRSLAGRDVDSRTMNRGAIFVTGSF